MTLYYDPDDHYRLREASADPGKYGGPREAPACIWCGRIRQERPGDGGVVLNSTRLCPQCAEDMKPIDAAIQRRALAQGGSNA